jgi:hypothetical protein
LDVDGNEVERCKMVGVGRRMNEERQYISTRPVQGGGSTTIPDYERSASSPYTLAGRKTKARFTHGTRPGTIELVVDK